VQSNINENLKIEILTNIAHDSIYATYANKCLFDIYVSLNQYLKALHHIKICLKAHPDNEDFHVCMIKCLSKAYLVKEIVKYLNEEEKIDLFSKETRKLLSKYFIDSMENIGHDLLSLENLSKAIGYDPSNVKAIENACNIYKSIKPEAISDFLNKCFKAHPSLEICIFFKQFTSASNEEIYNILFDQDINLDLALELSVLAFLGQNDRISTIKNRYL
jgi:hypothetical protein